MSPIMFSNLSETRACSGNGQCPLELPRKRVPFAKSREVYATKGALQVYFKGSPKGSQGFP